MLCRLPCRFVVPLPIRESEMLYLTAREWESLDHDGMETHDLPPHQMKDVFALKRRHGRLSANDCFCLVTAHCHEDGIFLTGDGYLRSVAAAAGVRVHGVLWIVDELEVAGVCDDAFLIGALEIWKTDRSVLLPDHLVDQRLRRLR